MRREERVEQGRRTRADFLDAAALEFAARGYDGASLADIAARAGKDKSALRYHFTTKSDLARAVVDEQYAVWGRMIAAAVEIKPRGLAALLDVFGAAITQSEQSPLAAAVLRLRQDPSAAEAMPPELPFRWGAVLDRHLAEAREDGEIPADRAAESIKALFIDGSLGAYESARRAGSGATTEAAERFESMWRTLLLGLGVADPEPVLARARNLKSALTAAVAPPVEEVAAAAN